MRLEFLDLYEQRPSTAGIPRGNFGTCSVGCLAGLSGDTAHEFGLELDPATRVCGYTKAATAGITGYAYWLVSPKDGSYRVYGVNGNSALVRNDAAAGTTDTTQYFSWALNRIADRTGNTIEFSYTQSQTTGELDIAEIDYTGSIAVPSALFSAAASNTYANVKFGYTLLPAASQRIDYVADMQLALTQQLTTITMVGPANHNDSSVTPAITPTTPQTVRVYHLNYGVTTASGLSVLTSLKECVPNGSAEVCYPSTQFTWDNAQGTSSDGYPNVPSAAQNYPDMKYAIDFKSGDIDGDGRQDMVFLKDQSCDNTGSGATRFQFYVALANDKGFASPTATGVYVSRVGQGGVPLPGCGTDWRTYHFETLWSLYDFSGDGRDDLIAANGTAWNGTNWTDMAWRIYPAKATGSNGAYTFDTTNVVNTNITSHYDDDGLLMDLNGDGLPDLLHENLAGGIEAELLQKAASGTQTFQFNTTPYTFNPTLANSNLQVNIGFATQAGRNLLNADLNGDGASDLVLQITDTSNNCGNNSLQRPGSGNALASGGTYHFEPSSQVAQLPLCKVYWATFRNTGFAGGTFNATMESTLGQVVGSCDTATTQGATTPGRMPCDGSFINFVDVNGDGQADVVYAKFDASNNGNYTYYYRLNGGKANDASSTPDRFLPEQATGLSVTKAYAEHVQLLDVNGDHRADLVYWTASGSTFPLKAQLWSAVGFGSAIDIGNTTLNAQDPTKTLTMFADVEGKGVPDLVRYSTSGVQVYPYGPSYGGNDVLTYITNGLGASTSILYYPLSYAGYSRAYDGPAQNWGRGSTVFDVASAVWVVHMACSSAPIPGTGSCNQVTGQDAMSGVVYRYSGAKIQAGGRGFLGFKTVQAEDQQAQLSGSNTVYRVTTTEYRQDFPFIGRPDHTIVQLETALQADPCISTPNNSCFVHDPPSCGNGTRCNAPLHVAAIGVTGAQTLSDAADSYASTPAFAAGTVKPLMPYLSNSDEQKFDVTSNGTLSHEITSSFTDDTYGNVTYSSVISSETSGTDETKTTTSIFGCTTAPVTAAACGQSANLSTEWQRLGRLSMSTVVSTRGSGASQQNNTRRASFEYDSTTLLRIAEIQGPYDDLVSANEDLSSLGLRTDLIRDGFGNVIEQVVCSTADFANRNACKNLTNFQQRQWIDPTTSLAKKIQRYAKWDIESTGRFELDKKVPFYSATGTSNTDENIAEYVGIAIGTGSAARKPTGAFTPNASITVSINRDAFGNPLNQFDSAGHGVSFYYGILGRMYQSQGNTGEFSRTVYTWCKDVTNAEISANAPRANCPSSATYRVQTDSAATQTPYTGQSVAPTTWTYYDLLGREVLRTKRIYQQDPQNGTSLYHWSSVVTTYDSTGRVATTSTPYFSTDPTIAESTSRAGTVQKNVVNPGTASTTYDPVDRVTKQTHPEELVNGSSSNSQWSYAELATTSTNPRSYQTKEVKNARDEVVSVTAPLTQTNALTVTYGRDAVGNLTSITRTPSDGDSAGVAIQNQMRYDRLGRKTSLTDPDKGSWTYTVNALGETILQTDAKGQTQYLYRDALGRIYQRKETRLSGSSYTSEPTSTWEFDTALRSSDSSKIDGAVHIESNGIAGIGGFQRTMSYDVVGRVTSVSTAMDSYTYAESQTYDQFNRPFQHFDPTTNNATAGELTLYSADGYPIGTQEAADSVAGVVYNQVQALSERGQVTQEEFHGNAALTTTRTYDDSTGRLLTVNTDSGLVQNWTYDYDKHSNLTLRHNQASGYDLQEDFTYDDLDRLWKVTLTVNGTAGNPMTVGYDQLGNLTSKTAGTNVQTWAYAKQAIGCSQSAGPHAVSWFNGATFCYDANGNQVLANYGGSQTRTITYTGYDLPAQIVTNGTPSVATESFSYAPDRAMYKKVDGAVSNTTSDKIFCNGFQDGVNDCAGGTIAPATVYYVGNVEARVSGGTTTLKRYIGGYLVVTTTVTGTSTSTPAYAYLFRDVIGSIDAITDENGNITQRQSFDAWGNRRDASSTGKWALLGSGAAAFFDTSITFQGFTGHQQLDPVGLIHMKGRLYDPVLGRFIQADSMVESDATQGLNRYSYVLNNPLSLTDPSGHLSFRQVLGIAIAVVAACFGQYEISQGALGWAFAIEVAGGFLSAYVSTGSFKAGLWGAFTGAVFFGIGASFAQYGGELGTGFLGSGYSSGMFAANVAAHGAAGGLLQTMQHGSFGNGFITSGVTAALSPEIDQIGNAPARVVASALLGGTVSKAGGGSFANGATAAALQSIFEGAVESRTGENLDTTGESGETVVGTPYYIRDYAAPVVNVAFSANTSADTESILFSGAATFYESIGIPIQFEAVAAGTPNALNVYLASGSPWADFNSARSFTDRTTTSILGHVLSTKVDDILLYAIPHSMATVFTHELGHAFGLNDRYDPVTQEANMGYETNLMGPYGGTSLYQRQMSIVSMNVSHGWAPRLKAWEQGY